MSEKPSKLGRPSKYDSARSTLTIRVTRDMREALKSRIEKSGRSFSEEIELILEKVIFPILPSDDEAAA